jgi:hypothetical protein
VQNINTSRIQRHNIGQGPMVPKESITILEG